MILDPCVGYYLCPGGVFAKASNRFIRKVGHFVFLVGLFMASAMACMDGRESCVFCEDDIE